MPTAVFIIFKATRSLPRIFATFTKEEKVTDTFAKERGRPARFSYYNLAKMRAGRPRSFAANSIRPLFWGVSSHFVIVYCIDYAILLGEAREEITFQLTD